LQWPSQPIGQQRNAVRAACRPRTPLQQRILGIRPRRTRVQDPDRRRARFVRTVLRSRHFPTEDPDLARHRRRLPDLENEIHFNPALFYNVNLDPTRRYGSETSASLRVSDTLAFRGGVAYTRAVFREGAFAGNDVPLVSRYTASGGVTWNIWQNYLVFDATVRAWSERFMDNDQNNTQRRIPADATVDLKLSGAYERFFWSVGVNNLFNALYYDYAIASTFTPGRFSAYPLPGRTFMVKAGATF
jgi:outer membrane receptor protein involved in Fe transport